LSAEQKVKLFDLDEQILPQLLKKSVTVGSLQDFFSDI
jgi:hypothetical protein